MGMNKYISLCINASGWTQWNDEGILKNKVKQELTFASEHTNVQRV